MGEKIETGRINYRDEEGLLWEAVSYQDEETGVVTTQATLIPEGDVGEVH